MPPTRRSNRPRQPNIRYARRSWDKATSQLLRESSESLGSSPSGESENRVDDDSSVYDSDDEGEGNILLHGGQTRASLTLDVRSPGGSVKQPDRSRYGSGSGKYRVTGLYAERLQYWDTGHSRGLKPFGRTAKAMLVTYENVFGPTVEDLRLVLNARDHWGWARDITLPSRTTLADIQSSALPFFASSHAPKGSIHLEALLTSQGERSRYSPNPVSSSLLEPLLVFGKPHGQGTVKIPAQESIDLSVAGATGTRPGTRPCTVTQHRYSAYHDASQSGWILNTDRRINTLAWMPNSDTDQYLAIAYKSQAWERAQAPSVSTCEPTAFRPSPPWVSKIEILHFTSIRHPENEQAQLSTANVPNLITKTSLTCGDVRQLTWSPGPLAGNIQVLGVLSSDGLVRVIVYKLDGPDPVAEMLTASIKAEPPENAVFTEVAWVTSTDLAVGASDGSLRLYNVLKPSGESSIQPYLVHQLHDTYIMTLSPAFPSSTPFYIASRSASGDMSLTDLRSPTQDRVDIPKYHLPVKALVYAPFTRSWITFGETKDNEMLQTTIECRHLRHFYGEVPIAKLSPLEGQGTALASSSHHPSILIGSAKGTVFATNYLRTVIPTSVYRPEMDGYLQKVCEYQFKVREEASHSDAVGGTTPLATQDAFHGPDVHPGTSFFSGPSKPVPLDDGTRKRRKNQTRESTAVERGAGDSMESVTFNDEQAVTAMAWNPNHKFTRWAAVGWGSGIVRVMDLSHDAA
ncbi:hypothetical protein DV736_g1579, partial [Chaetothyriales sp. CBS 134916]